jgi:hypothetical protein
MSAYRNTRRLLCASAALLALTSVGHADDPARRISTLTPIKHLVVIFGENQTFDRYFATYPNAANKPGEQGWVGRPASEFHARPDTPRVNGLTPTLLHNNPNTTLTGAQANPQRLGPAEGVTCDMNHGYTAEEMAADGGRMDRFVQSTSSTAEGCQVDGSTVMNYFDGNSVTALWNYAQHYAMSDAFFGTTYGPSTPGHVNLISANTHGLILHGATSNSAVYMNPVDGSQTLISDLPGFLDDCGGSVSFEMTGRNVGDLLNAKNTPGVGLPPVLHRASRLPSIPTARPRRLPSARRAIRCTSTRSTARLLWYQIRLSILPRMFTPQRLTTPTATRLSCSTQPPATRTTCRLVQWQRLARPIRPITTTIPRISSPPLTLEIFPPSPT